MPLPGTERHPHARAVLGPALATPGAARPSHAYLFHGPAGSGKGRVARALAGALLTEGVADATGAAARVEHGTHPDLTWVTPSGAHEMLVGDIDQAVVGAASRTPFEARWRVFVLERAETLVEAAANKLLKTLEEPGPHVVLILLTERLGEVLPTIASRCQAVRFDPVAPEELAAALAARGVPEEQARACARLALGDGDKAHALAEGDGAELRAGAERFARAVLGARDADPGAAAQDLLGVCSARGEKVLAAVGEQEREARELVAQRDRRRHETEWAERARRARRRAETEALDLGLQLVALWYRDLAAVAHDAPELACHADRAGTLVHDAAGRDPVALRRAVEHVEETRRRLELNVTERLALDALAVRLERELEPAR